MLVVVQFFECWRSVNAFACCHDENPCVASSIVCRLWCRWCMVRGLRAIRRACAFRAAHIFCSRRRRVRRVSLRRMRIWKSENTSHKPKCIKKHFLSRAMSSQMNDVKLYCDDDGVGVALVYDEQSIIAIMMRHFGELGFVLEIPESQFMQFRLNN